MQTTETTYKVIDVKTGKVLKDNLDFYAGRAFMGDSSNVTMTETTTDIADALTRRANLIAAQEADDTIKTLEQIHVNSYGEFDKGCVCHNGDFYPVQLVNGEWVEIEPVEGAKWAGYACITCDRVFSDGGLLIAHPTEITYLQ